MSLLTLSVSHKDIGN